MVLLIPLIASIPTVIGVSEAVASQRRADANAKGKGKSGRGSENEKAQMRKFTLECYCAGGKGRRAREIHGGKVVLGEGKVSDFLFV